jgi:hypothetical protein
VGPRRSGGSAGGRAEIVRLAEQEGHRELALRGHGWCLIAVLELGDAKGVQAQLSAYERLAEELHQPRYRWCARTRQSMWASLIGDLSEAEKLVREAMGLGRDAGEPDTESVFAAQLLRIALERPNLWPELWEVFDAVTFTSGLPSDAPIVQAYRAQRMYFALHTGREDEARRELAWFRQSGLGSICRTFLWPVVVVRLAPVVAQIGTAEEAAALYDALLPFAAGNALNSGAVTYEGSYSHYLGLLGACLGRWGDADRHFADAAAMHERMGARPFLARTRLAWADMLRSRNRPEDGGRSRELLTYAVADARSLGLHDVERTASSL